MNNGQFSPGFGPILALVAVMAASIWLGNLARKAVMRGKFLQGYFLGNRGLGAWALALTATVQSGGTFMGFPSLVYTYGWIVALWIASYMVVPLTGFGLVAKRLAHLSRRAGAITVPDLFRARFDSPRLGLITSFLIVFCLLFTMSAQFKAGAIVMKLAFPGTGAFAASADGTDVDESYFIGLAIFACVVVGYTLVGGFLASVWTDLFQSVLMFIGVVVLVLLTIPAVGGLEQATRQAVDNTGPEFALAPGYAGDFASDADEANRQFLPISLAFSFFFIWVFGGVGSPASLVRMMACKSSGTIRRSMVLLAVYNVFIYLPLIFICIAARAVLPNLFETGDSDEVVPRMAFWATRDLPGGSIVAGIILAAPFGAIMATVSTYLVVIASGVVRDVYQRFFRPRAMEREIRVVTYSVVLLVGLIGVLANIRPPQFLQALVVFAAQVAAASFVVPTALACYSRKATAAGVMAAMLGGAATVVSAYVAGMRGWGDALIGQRTGFRPLYLIGLDPIVWALGVSLLLGIVISRMTQPPREKTVARFFDV